MNAAILTTELSELEIEKLESLIGGTLEFLGGDHLPDLMFASQFVVFTNRCALVFQGDVVQADLEGYVENYSRIRVVQVDEAEVSRLGALGRLSFDGPNQVIQNVEILRRTITEYKNGVVTWQLQTSRAVVLDLGTTNLCFSKLGEHDEALAVTSLLEFQSSKLPTTSSYFETDFKTSYVIREDLFSLK
ncbi:MAG: hypothetical protein RIS55_200 [Actinomycetota bacterium]